MKLPSIIATKFKSNIQINISKKKTKQFVSKYVASYIRINIVSIEHIDNFDCYKNKK